MFLYFKKLVAAIHSLMDTVFILEQHLQPWIVYIKCIWQIFLFKAYCSFKVELAAPYIPVDTRRRLNVVRHSTTSYRRWNNVLCLRRFEWYRYYFRSPLGSDLIFSRYCLSLKSWNRPCFQIYWVDSPPVAAIHSSNGLFLL